MAWYRQAILIMAIALFTGCGRSDLPADIYIEDRWSAEEEAAIVLAIDEWNDTAMTYLADPHPLFTYRGRRAGRFDSRVFNDDYHVIYRIGSPAEAPPDQPFPSPGGYGTMTDIMLYTFHLGEGGDNYLGKLLRECALHEMGHFLSLPHFENALGIMNPYGYNAKHLTEADIDQFCIFYECRR